MVGMLAKIRKRNFQNTNHTRCNLSHLSVFVVLVSYICTVPKERLFPFNIILLVTIISPTLTSIMYAPVTVLFVMLITETTQRYFCVLEWLSTGFWLDIGFIDHFKTQLVITLNYSAIANFHNLQITSAHANSFPACSVFTRRFLITVSNNGYSSASVLKSSLNVGSLPTACLPYNWLAANSHQPPGILFTDYQLTTELRLSILFTACQLTTELRLSILFTDYQLTTELRLSILFTD
jgi:hypothetical protein